MSLNELRVTSTLSISSVTYS
ncbi:hypothetical protein KUF71_021419 [Frankliniella fusca]|uniref:Uncharacterized protein n=1 Tax=Frankliniella fusca TaxID=407009 RepID=A0AAE1GZL7_9NEOP|nr:hypothetical protein KUF71_004340 [Frankliniella fusca]KAK3911758.1 hypothetical protein KUF71_021419 [Frankliniella fusca]